MQSLMRTRPMPLELQQQADDGSLRFRGRMFSFERSPIDDFKFSAATRYVPEFALAQGATLPGPLRVLWDHGWDDTIRQQELGFTTETSLEEDGVWVMAQILRSNEYQREVARLVELSGRSFDLPDGSTFQFMLGMSASAVAGNWYADDAGDMELFIPSEVSLTPIPANPGTLGVMAQSVAPSTMSMVARFYERQAALQSAAADAAADRSAATNDDRAPSRARMAKLQWELAQEKYHGVG